MLELSSPSTHALWFQTHLLHKFVASNFSVTKANTPPPRLVRANNLGTSSVRPSVRPYIPAAFLAFVGGFVHDTHAK